jgi:hypothetical protein
MGSPSPREDANSMLSSIPSPRLIPPCSVRSLSRPLARPALSANMSETVTPRSEGMRRRARGRRHPVAVTDREVRRRGRRAQQDHQRPASSIRGRSGAEVGLFLRHSRDAGPRRLHGGLLLLCRQVAARQLLQHRPLDEAGVSLLLQPCRDSMALLFALYELPELRPVPV